MRRAIICRAARVFLCGFVRRVCTENNNNVHLNLYKVIGAYTRREQTPAAAQRRSACVIDLFVPSGLVLVCCASVGVGFMWRSSSLEFTRSIIYIYIHTYLLMYISKLEVFGGIVNRFLGYAV